MTVSIVTESEGVSDDGNMVAVISHAAQRRGKERLSWSFSWAAQIWYPDFINHMVISSYFSHKEKNTSSGL